MKKKALSIILSVAILTTPLAFVNVSAEELGFADGFETGKTDYSDEVSDSEEEMLSFASGDEVYQSGENQKNFSSRTVEIASMPNKTVFVYGNVKLIDDFDLTGMSINVKNDDSEETISFSKNGEKKQDSAGNVYECKIRKKDNPEETGEEIVPGGYIVSIEYDDGSVRVLIRVLPGSAAKDAVRQASGVYTASIDKKGFVKLVPEESGKYEIVDNVKRYNEEEETDEYISRVFDDQLLELETKSVYDLEKGKTYYLYPNDMGDGIYTFFVNPVSQGNSGVCGANAVWKIENGVMTISGSGATYKYRYDDKREWKDVESVVIEDGITVIGDNMFSGCSNLKVVQIADSVEKIRGGAFSRCTSLKEAAIPKTTIMGGSCFTEKDVTLLKVYANSDAERYAKTMGFKYEVIGSHIHSWDAGVVTTPATCTENGIRTYTCAAGGETRTETIPATGHRYGDYKVTKEATIFNTGTESRECQVCHNQETREIPKLTAEVKLTVKTLPVQVKKSVSAKNLIASKDSSDSIASLTSSNVKVAAVDNKNFKVTAKKAGKAVITVTMKSGATSDITVNVKTKKIATTKISGVKKAITLKKGKKYTLKPVLSPITSTDKVTYSSANKKIATVSSKGVIKALKKGKVKIAVKAGKKTVTCVVTVK